MSSQPEEFYVPRGRPWPPKAPTPVAPPMPMVPPGSTGPVGATIPSIPLPPGVTLPSQAPMHIHVHIASPPQPQNDVVMRRHWAMSWGGFGWILFWSLAVLGLVYGGLRLFGVNPGAWW